MTGGCGISWTICKSFAPHSRQITTPVPITQLFYGPYALPDAKPTVVINHSLSASFIYYNPWHPLCSIYVPDSLFPQSLFKFSLVYLLARHPSLRTPYTSSPNHCLPFCSMCPYHRNLSCCSIEVMSSYPSLSLNPLPESLSCSLTPHFHLTILISARWSAHSFSFLTGQVSLPCNILLDCKNPTQIIFKGVSPIWSNSRHEKCVYICGT